MLDGAGGVNGWGRRREEGGRRKEEGGRGGGYAGYSIEIQSEQFN